MKKFLAIIMCLVMCAVCIPAYAGEPAKLSITAQKGSGSFYLNKEEGGRDKVELEDVIVVSVEIQGAYDAEVCSGVLYINYDNTAVDCLGYKGFYSWEVNDKEPGALRLAFSRSEEIDDGQLFAAAFTLKEDVDAARFELRVAELLTGDVVDGDVPADYMITQGFATYAEAVEPPVDELLMGDANLDEKVNTADAVQVLKHSAEMLTLEGKAFTQADVNYDRAVNTADATLILKYAAGMITQF